MYKEAGIISDDALAELQTTLCQVKWETHISKVTSHQAAPCPVLPDELKSLGEAATFIRLPPGGNLYRHHDDGEGHMIPIETNDDCLSLSYRDGKREQHLEVGKIYHCDRTIDHESLNNGKTNRTHLVIAI
jgi:hypothetical protein